MDKKEFITFLNQIFLSFGFKKKGNNWSQETEELIKGINLQKSNFGNFYYINYSWNIKSLKDQGIDHVNRRFSSTDKIENARIDELLNLDEQMDANNRKIELYSLINAKVIEKLQSINTEKELLMELQSRPHLNDVPLIIKKYFGI